MARLPNELRTIGYGLLYRDSDGNEFTADEQKDVYLQQQSAVQALEELSVDDRPEIFAVLFSALAPHVESTWQMLKLAPYGQSYARKAFRAPHSPKATFANRLVWLNEMIDMAATLKP